MVDVPAGVDDGQTLRLPGRGAGGLRGGPAGDLYVHLRVRNHPTITRRGTDLLAVVHVAATQAALGTSLAVRDPRRGGAADDPARHPERPRAAAARPGRAAPPGSGAGRPDRHRGGGHPDGPHQGAGGAAAPAGRDPGRGSGAARRGLHVEAAQRLQVGAARGRGGEGCAGSAAGSGREPAGPALRYEWGCGGAAPSVGAALGRGGAALGRGGRRAWPLAGAALGRGGPSPGCHLHPILVSFTSYSCIRYQNRSSVAQQAGPGDLVGAGPRPGWGGARRPGSGGGGGRCRRSSCLTVQARQPDGRRRT